MKGEDVLKIRSVIRTIVMGVMICFILVALGSIVAGWMKGKQQVMVLGWGVSHILTGSMEPTIPVGSLILIHNQKEYEVGDIVTYEGNSRPVTHRIIAINGDMIVTQGDSNNGKDIPFDRSRVIGKVVCTIPRLGELLATFKNPIGIGVIAVLFGMMWLKPCFDARRGENEEQNKT